MRWFKVVKSRFGDVALGKGRDDDITEANTHNHRRKKGNITYLSESEKREARRYLVSRESRVASN